MLHALSSAAIVILVVGFTLGVGALVVKLILDERAQRGKRAAAMQALGFTDCPDHIDHIEDMIAFLSGDNSKSARTHTVSHPMLRQSNGERIYYIWIKESRSGDSTAWVETFLFPFARRVEQPVALMLSTQKTQAKIMKFVLGLAARMFGERFTLLDMPRELEGSHILGAFGPRGCSLYDLLDSSVLSQVQHGAELGVNTFRAYQDWAAVSLDPKQKKADTAQVWPFIERLAALR